MTKALSPLRNLAARIGLDTPKLLQSLWLVITAFLAMTLAWALGLDHPQWAAITVFVTLQPSRGQTIEKNIYRFVGTLTGSAYGLLLLTIAQGNLIIIALGLMGWSGLCLAIGTLQRSYRSYGTVLAGYSAIIIAMNNTGPADMAKWIALDRVSAIVIGLIAGIALSYLIAPKSNREELEQKTRRLLADTLKQTAANLGRDGLAQAGQNYKLTAAAAELSAQFATLAARHVGVQAVSDPLEGLLVCTTNLLLASTRARANAPLAEALGQLGTKLHSRNDFAGTHRALSKSMALTDDPVLEDALLALASAVPDDDGSDRGLAVKPAEASNWQYDWKGARQAAMRIMLVTGSIGLAWALTGQAIMQFALISSAIVVSLASSGVSPSRAMRDVVIGQLIAAVAALICEMLIWDQGLSGPLQIATMIPFFIFYALIRSHRKISLSATDYALTLLLLLTPTHVPYAPVYPAPEKALLAVSGGIIGYIAFRFLFPINATRRRKGLWSMIKRELQEIATAPPGRGGSPASWRLRFVARFLKIVNWTFHEAHSGESPTVTMRKGLLTLALGDLVYAARGVSRMPDPGHGVLRANDVFLRRIHDSNRENARLLSAVARLGERAARAKDTDPAINNLANLCQEVVEQMQALTSERAHSKKA